MGILKYLKHGAGRGATQVSENGTNFTEYKHNWNIPG